MWPLTPRRRFGWHPDPEDPRDRLLALRSASAPTAASLSHPAVAARDQGSTGSCVGFAVAQGAELAYARQGVMTGDLSPLFTYALSRATHGEAFVDGGTYVRAAIKSAARFGFASEASHPFRLGTQRAPGLRAFRDAYDRRGLRSYYRIDPADLNLVRLAIAAGFPVVGGWRVDRAFMSYDGSGILPAREGDVLGGHAMVVVGYDSQSFRLLNSWSTRWGAGGYAVVSPEWLAQGHDFWALDVRGTP